MCLYNVYTPQTIDTYIPTYMQCIHKHTYMNVLYTDTVIEERRHREKMNT